MSTEGPQLDSLRRHSQGQGPPLSPLHPLGTEVPGRRPRPGAFLSQRHDIVIACMFRARWPLLRNRLGFSEPVEFRSPSARQTGSGLS